MKKITLFTFLTILLCTSCVTKKKFMLAEMAATASKDSLQGLLNNSREVGNQLSAQVKNLLRDTTKMGNSIRQYQSMLNVNMTEQEKLNALLSQKKNELNERERTINELQDMIKAQNDKVQNLLSNVKDALLGFSTDELTVREKDGKVYVAMSDKLLAKRRNRLRACRSSWKRRMEPDSRSCSSRMVPGSPHRIFHPMQRERRRS